MANNPILDEIHQTREALAQQHGNDLKAICLDLQQKQKLSGHRLVHFLPKLISPDADKHDARRND